MILGCDISSIQGVQHWPTLAPKLHALGVRFVIHRCGYGNEPQSDDAAFAENIAGARGEGFIVGAYHFGMPLPDGPGLPAGRNPEEQAQRHFEVSDGLGSLTGDLVPFLDLEWPWPTGNETLSACWARWGVTEKSIRNWTLPYLAKMTALIGRPCGIYNGFPNFWRAVDGSKAPGLAAYPLWDVSYPYGQKSPREPVDGEGPSPAAPWAGWSIWQFTGGGLPVMGGVDGDVIADEATLARLRGL
jgi:GH25 family lysozyme M1 (1,4-beta-N-acetylmuramidase)